MKKDKQAIAQKDDDNIIPLHKKQSSTVKQTPSLEISNKKSKKMATKKQQSLCAHIFMASMKLKDIYTHGHLLRVAFYSLMIGKEINLNEDELFNLELTSILHDVGKIGIPDSILKKPSHLNQEEFEIMKGHAYLSYKTLSAFPIFEEIAQYAKYHHERYDGKGYPDQLKGDQIPLISRIILIADTFDAMTSTRPYRKGINKEIAYQELTEFAGTQFDPSLVEKFLFSLKRDRNKKQFKFSLNIISGKFLKDAA